MLKADMKLPIWLGLIAIVISIIFTSFLFNALIIIIYLGTVYLIIYFILGYVRRIDALVIDNDLIKVRTPFKYVEWNISEFDSVFLADKVSSLKGVIIIEDEVTEVTICTDIYSKKLKEIYSTLITSHPKLEIV